MSLLEVKNLNKIYTARKGNTKVQALEDVSFITRKEIDDWSPIIPPIWCGNYAWAESGLKTIKYIGEAEKLSLFNVDRCLAYALSLRPHKSILWKMGWRYADSKIRFVLLFIFLFVKKYFVKIRNNLPFNVKKSNAVNTILDAEQFFMKYALPFSN